MSRPLTLADGQLGASSGTVLAGVDGPPSNRINVILGNTGATDETVILKFRREGGTARQIVRAVLKEYQGLFVRGLPIQVGDTLLGETTTGATVDYLVTASDDAGFGVVALAADGGAKQYTIGSQVVSGDVDIVTSPSVEGLLEEIRDLLRRHILAVEMVHGIEVPVNVE